MTTIMHPAASRPAASTLSLTTALAAPPAGDALTLWCCKRNRTEHYANGLRGPGHTPVPLGDKSVRRNRYLSGHAVRHGVCAYVCVLCGRLAGRWGEGEARRAAACLSKAGQAAQHSFSTRRGVHQASRDDGVHTFPSIDPLPVCPLLEDINWCRITIAVASWQTYWRRPPPSSSLWRMIRGSLVTRTRHFCKCLAGEARRHLILSLCVFVTLVFINVAIYNYGCDYMSPPSMPVDLNSTHLNQFLIKEADFCHRQTNLSFIVYIHSSLDNVEKRQETRLTWASAGLYDPSVRMAVVFMVGQAKNKYEEIILSEESHRYHDIVQGNYTDTYHMLSYKALSSLNWLTHYCSHVPWTIHADDDVLIDVFLMQKFLKNNSTRDSFFCYPWDKSSVRRHGKWCVRSNEYPEDMYPIYCAGGAWMLATPLVQRLLDAAGRVPIMWVDDVYLTGLLSKNAGIPVSTSLKKNIRTSDIYKEDLGKTMIWFNPGQPRTIWWYKLLSFHGYVSEIDV